MKFERPLLDKELAVLNKRLSQLDKKFKSYARFLLIWTLIALIVGAIVYFRMETKNEILLLLATVFIYIGIGVWVVIEAYLSQQKERKSIGYLKNKNIVTVVKVISDKYIQLDEEEDEGTFYLFQLADNKVFSFSDQSFSPNEQFPSNNFEVVEGRGFKDEILLLELYSTGNKINPIQNIKGKEKWNLLDNPKYPDPEKLTIAEGQIEDFLHANTPQQL